MLERKNGTKPQMGEAVREIAGEYFDTALFMLSYEPDEEYQQIRQAVVGRICQVLGAEAVTEECMESICRTDCLKTAADGVLLNSSQAISRNVLLDMKLERLTARKIMQLKVFDRSVFFREVEAAASEGNISACKLLAMLHWLDICPDSSKKLALSVWKMLAMSGDRFAVSALVKAFGQGNMPKEEALWRHISEILEGARRSFAPMVMGKDYPDYSDEELDTANLILYISQKAVRQAGCIDRAMLYYALNSRQDYAVIMGNLSTVQNFHLAMRMEQRSECRRIGF